MKKDNSFFSQGSYGCVSHPPIKCPTSRKGENKTENKMVSKLVRNDVFAKNELHMGMKLKEILKNHNREYTTFCEVNKKQNDNWCASKNL